MPGQNCHGSSGWLSPGYSRADGNIIQTIKPKIKPVPFTKKDKEKVIASWKENGYTPALIDKLMKRTDFPDKYPPIMTCELADGKIYVITYRKRPVDMKALSMT